MTHLSKLWLKSSSRMAPMDWMVLLWNIRPVDSHILRLKTERERKGAREKKGEGEKKGEREREREGGKGEELPLKIRQRGHDTQLHWQQFLLISLAVHWWNQQQKVQRFHCVKIFNLWGARTTKLLHMQNSILRYSRGKNTYFAYSRVVLLG